LSGSKQTSEIWTSMVRLASSPGTAVDPMWVDTHRYIAERSPQGFRPAPRTARGILLGNR
jgi:hypothetical protein